MARRTKVRRHGGLKQLAPNVWIVRGGGAIPIDRNMVVIRRDTGELVLHSPVALNEAGLKALAALGKSAVMIVPSKGHQSDAPFYAERFPEMIFICPAGARSAVEPNVRVAATIEDMIPALGWKAHRIPAFNVAEFVIEVPLEGGGRALVVNDLFGGANSARQSLAGLLITPLATPGNRFGITRIVRWRVIENMATIRKFAEGLAAIPDLRLITVSHGEAVSEAPAAALRAAVAA